MRMGVSPSAQQWAAKASLGTKLQGTCPFETMLPSGRDSVYVCGGCTHMWMCVYTCSCMCVQEREDERNKRHIHINVCTCG